MQHRGLTVPCAHSPPDATCFFYDLTGFSKTRQARAHNSLTEQDSTKKDCHHAPVVPLFRSSPYLCMRVFHEYLQVIAITLPSGIVYMKSVMNVIICVGMFVHVFEYQIHNFSSSTRYIPEEINAVTSNRCLVLFVVAHVELCRAHCVCCIRFQQHSFCKCFFAVFITHPTSHRSGTLVASAYTGAEVFAAFAKYVFCNILVCRLCLQRPATCRWLSSIPSTSMLGRVPRRTKSPGEIK